MTQQNQNPNQPSNSGFTFEQKIILFNLILTAALVAVVFIAMWQFYQPKIQATPQVIVVTVTTKLTLPTAEPTKPSIYAMPTIPAFGIGGRPIHQETNAVVVTLSVEDQKLADDLINQMKTDVAK